MSCTLPTIRVEEIEPWKLSVTEQEKWTVNVCDLLGIMWLLVAYGARLVLQSPDGTYWDVTPDINAENDPVSIPTPATPPQTQDLDVPFAQNIGFIQVDGSVTDLNVDNYKGIYMNKWITATSTQTLGELVFTYASGKSLIRGDIYGNRWKVWITNDGEIRFYTV